MMSLAVNAKALYRAVVGTRRVAVGEGAYLRRGDVVAIHGRGWRVVRAAARELVVRPVGWYYAAAVTLAAGAVGGAWLFAWWLA